MKLRASLFALVMTAALFAPVAAAEKSAEDAWKEVEAAAKPPVPPPEWAGQEPTEAQKEAFQNVLAAKSIEAAEKAQAFHTSFPDHPKAAEAKDQERRFVQQALNFGATGLPKSLEAALPEEERIGQKLNLLNRRALAKQPQGMPAVIKEFESGLRGLIKEHPQSSLLWSQMMVVVQNTEDKDAARKLLDEVAGSKAADDETRDRAKGMLRALGAIGRPLEIAFTATDGSAVDVQKMKGKVILLDFWASWCGPCIASFPEVIELYTAYHPKGLEILGINLDKDRAAMNSAIKRFEIPWRQYFDGRGWGNKYALEYNVGAIPSMWLVDKNGILRTMEAREDLEKQVKELLAEPAKL